jgi:nucleoside-diphosphate kinase
LPIERTLSIVKPDAVARGLTGTVIQAFEEKGLKLRGLRMLLLSPADAARFYHVHRQRPFFASLTAYMSSGPVVAMALEGEGAIGRVREIMGATDPAKAAEGTLRRRHGESIERNVVHGSDAPATAAFEIGFFFRELDLAPPAGAGE